MISIGRMLYTVKRPRRILFTKVGISLGPGLILHGHFQQTQNVFYRNIWLLKVSMQNESEPEAYWHFCEKDVTWSFYSVPEWEGEERHRTKLQVGSCRCQLQPF